jgi:HEPN domain-containing protein
MSADNARDLARVWLQSARDTLRVAEWASNTGLYADAVFNAQQTAEKALKAYLLFHTREFPFTHDLRYLQDLCRRLDATFGSLDLEAIKLNEYYTEPRYLDTAISHRQYTDAVAIQAVQFARNVLAVVEPRMV